MDEMSKQEQVPLETHVVDSPEQAVALMNPLRAEILVQLREPASASEVARSINETPQRVNYHLKALEKVGLVRKVGTRQVRNLVEVLFQAIARTFILSETLGWDADTVQRAKDQGSLSHLITTAERMKRDALLLMEHSDAEQHIPSASLHMKVHLMDESTRAHFVKEYVETVERLVRKYQASHEQEGSYHVLLAVYPEANLK
jgi:DNA-binding transcriptional ArsR family regulator